MQQLSFSMSFVFRTLEPQLGQRQETEQIKERINCP